MEIRVAGLKEMQRALLRMTPEIRVPILERAARAGASILQDAIVSAAPVGATGNLRRSIGIRIRREGDAVSATVRPARPRGAHAHLVERGHRLIRQVVVFKDRKTGRFLSRKGQTRGRGGRMVGLVRPHPFFDPTVEATQTIASDAASKVLLEAVAEQVRRA